MLKDDDLRLLNALQIRPRASWSELSRAIGSDPVTLTRRWERLHSQGIAWIAAYRGGPIVSATALLEIECAPAQTMSVAEQIAHDPEVLTVDLTTGNRDLLVTLTCTDLDQLSRYVLERTQSLPMITAMRTQIVSSANSDARNWRLRALDAERNCRARVGPGGKDSWCTRRRRGTVAAVRHSFLANHVSPSRHSLRPSESRRLALGRSFLTSCRRGDWSSARRLLGPTPAGRSTPGTSYVSTGERRQLLSAFRTCVRRGLLLLRSAATDIALAVWLRSIDDVQRLEGYLADQFPGVSVVDRSIVLRTAASPASGRIDVSGRSMPKHG